MSEGGYAQENVLVGSPGPLEGLPEVEVFAESSFVVEGAELASEPPLEQALQVEELPLASLVVEDAEQAGDLPLEQALQVEELPLASFVVEDAELAGDPPLEQALEAEEIASFSLVVEDAELASEPPLEESREVVENTPAFLENSQLLEEGLQFLPGGQAEEEPPRSSFLDFYSLREQPFGVTPDPAYLYPSEMHREALRSLLCGIQNDRGFMALIAPPGMGKTTLLNKLIEELRDSARTVFLFQTQCDSREFFGYLLRELGEETAGMDLASMHSKLNAILFQEMLEGRRFVLIVDEAQNLDDSVLETIRLLSDFETTHAKLLEIVLVGQPELAAKLSRPGLSQLRQRIAILTKLEPMSAAETVRYIEHRLRVAGYCGGPLFAPDALELIAERSQGIPRSINNICFNALMAGYLEERKTIDAEIVWKVVEGVDLESLVPHTQQPEAVAGQEQPDRSCLREAQSRSRATLSGKVTGLLGSGHWGKGKEFRIQVSLERDPSCLPVANRHYCSSFYIGEKEATTFRAGQPVRITIEQD